MSPDALQRGFDKENKSQTEIVVRHVASCDPCGTALELLQGQRDALKFLVRAGESGMRQAGVEYILSSTARAGRDKLADLLYEMAKACLVMLPNLKRRVERRVEPRAVGLVSRELSAMNARLGTTTAGVTIIHVPEDVPTEPRALATAYSCLDVLRNVEGDSERQRLALSHVLIFQGKPTDAESLLRDLLARKDPLEHRDLAQWNLMLAMMRQKRYADTIDFGWQVLGERPSDCMILYNLAASFASLRQRAEFDSISARLARQLSSMEGGAPEWLINLLRFEVPNFAECFEMTSAEIENSFGLSLSNEEQGS